MPTKDTGWREIDGHPVYLGKWKGFKGAISPKGVTVDASTIVETKMKADGLLNEKHVVPSVLKTEVSKTSTSTHENKTIESATKIKETLKTEATNQNTPPTTINPSVMKKPAIVPDHVWNSLSEEGKAWTAKAPEKTLQGLYGKKTPPPTTMSSSKMATSLVKPSYLTDSAWNKMTPSQKAQLVAPSTKMKPGQSKVETTATTKTPEPLTTTSETKPGEFMKDGEPRPMGYTKEASEAYAARKKEWKAFEKTLTQKEQIAIENYTGSGYKAMNKALWSNPKPAVGSANATLVNAIKKAPPQAEDVILYRHMKSFPEHLLPKPGEVAQIPGFLSTANVSQHGFFTDGGVAFEIKVKKGQKGILSGMNSGEYEYILNNMSKLKYLGSKQQSYGANGSNNTTHQFEYID